jgi:hypothetical protein
MPLHNMSALGNTFIVGEIQKPTDEMEEVRANRKETQRENDRKQIFTTVTRPATHGC